MLWDVLRGRSRRKANNLDSLFAVPSAAITLQTALGFTPTGSGSVCYRSAAGVGFAETQADVVALISQATEGTAPQVRVKDDEFGFTWLEVEDHPDDIAGLCTDLHVVNTSLEANGFADGLLCSLIPFEGQGRRLGLVYLYKQGTFYPFAPTGGRQRDNLLELSVLDQLKGELPMETDLQRWLAVWGAPGL